jgi:hypothetical protein
MLWKWTTNVQMVLQIWAKLQNLEILLRLGQPSGIESVYGSLTTWKECNRQYHYPQYIILTQNCVILYHLTLKQKYNNSSEKHFSQNG